MKQQLNVRIVVLSPPKGVAVKVERGRDELLDGENNCSDIKFQFKISVDNSGATPNFLGEYAQGPRDARFVYVNSGTYAGQPTSCWSRRAKLSLMSVTREQVNDILGGKGAVLETVFN